MKTEGLVDPDALVAEPPNLCKNNPAAGGSWVATADAQWVDRDCDVTGFPRLFTEHATGPKPRTEVPTLKDSASRFIDGHARANQQKPSGIAHKETMLRLYLIPILGGKPLDTISTEDVQRLKQRLCQQALKSVNNVLTVLNMRGTCT